MGEWGVRNGGPKKKWRRKRNTCIRRGKWKTFTAPAIWQSPVHESFREWWGCGLQGALGQRQHTKSLGLLPHLQALLTPRRWKAGILFCVCQKTPRYGEPVQQGLRFVTWVPSSQVLTLLCFPLAAVLPGGDPVQENHNVTSHWQPPQHSRSEFTWDCQYLLGFFIYSLKHLSRNQANQKNKRSNLEAVFTWLNKSQMITLTVPSSGLVKGREHQP